eukprot:TRINITY_DN8479_c0_g1_i1.p1 TRINITY_DN8479_c0_g1~~TRINITY_DN8479_c0_g1_i1.p1  ORF type:complete len:280 (-),score=60.30 TRINITY_DN8479_c0_g1_i1:79-918(-)
MKSYSPVYYRKPLDRKSEDWERMEDVFYNFGEASSVLNVEEAFAVFNETLLQSYINQYKILTNRIKNNPSLFNKEGWRDEKGVEDRQKVQDTYKQRVHGVSWNANDIVPILPLLHGTDFAVACSIASSGFAILSSLDAGWFGKGIYFTSFVKYCIPYFSTRKEPSIIISFVTMGNVFPVTEPPSEPNSFLGAAMKPGYNSHYIVVTTEGVPANDDDRRASKPLYDEIVIPQESQIVPVYILRFKPFDSNKILKRWKEDMKNRRSSLFQQRDQKLKKSVM